jgi:hypothetical protein
LHPRDDELREVATLRVARRLLLAWAMANTFETISTEMLGDIGGGVGASGNVGNGHALTASAASNDQLLSSLNGIQSSLDNLGKNNGSFLSGTNGVMFMGMAALAMSRRPQTTVVYGGRGGYYWQSGW